MVIAAGFGLQAFADQRRDHVAGLQVEVVAWAVEVHRQQEDGVEAVLLAVGFALHQHHLLGQAVGRVGLLGVTVPQIFFFEGDGRVFGVGADGADGHKFAYPGPPRLVHQLRAHHQVVVEELGGLLAVDADAADVGSKMNND